MFCTITTLCPFVKIFVPSVVKLTTKSTELNFILINKVHGAHNANANNANKKDDDR